MNHYCDFNGRVTRGEWARSSGWFAGLYIILMMFCGAFPNLGGILLTLAMPPYLGISNRRFHDRDISGWKMFFLSTIALLLFLIILVATLFAFMALINREEAVVPLGLGASQYIICC